MTAMYKLTLLLLACIGQCTFLSGQQQERFLEIRGHAELELNPLGSATDGRQSHPRCRYRF